MNRTRLRTFLRLTPVALALVAPASRQILGAQSQDRFTKAQSQDAFVIEQLQTSYRFEKDGTGRREVYERVKVQSEAGVQQWGQLVFGYNASNERMDVLYVRVHKASGPVVAAGSDAVQDLSAPVQRVAPVYTDTREKHVTVPGLRPGDVLELSVDTVVKTAWAAGHFWMDHDFNVSAIVLDEQLQIDVPKSREVTLKTRPGTEPTLIEVGDRRIYRWKTGHLTSENNDRTSHDTATNRTRRPEPAAVRLTTFPNWDAVGRWFETLEKPQREPTTEIRRKALELTAGRATELEKLEALYDYVSANFRYVSLSFGVGRYQPHAAIDVLHNQYGDCKDKHTLLSSLAESIGLRASAALINSRAELDPDFPSPSQFDHVMTRVVVADEAIWLDSTLEVAPFRLLSANVRKRRALVVEPNGASQIAETPANPPMPNATIAEITAKLDESGELSAHVHLGASGDYELLLRTIFRRTPNTSWKTILDGISARGGLGAQISDWTISDPSSLREPFAIDFQATKPNFLIWSDKQFEIQLPWEDFVPFATAEGRESDDASPIELGPARQARYKIHLELPVTYAVRLPVPVSIVRDYGEYHADYALDGTLFTAERSFDLRQPELPSTRRGDLAAFNRVVRDDFRQFLSVESGAAPELKPAAAQAKAEELYRTGSDAIDSGRYSQAVTLLKRVVEIEPSHAKAWTNLGRAYMGLHQTDIAIEAFQKQIAINPYDLYAYSNLGAAYVAQQKLNEAEAAFRKQLEINPLDEYSHDQLGRLYLEQHQYKAAATELEKAISQSPRKADAHLRLGESYLNLGQHDRALAAFKRAVELDPNPWTWNNVAYQLVLKKTDMELAQRYAESAVAAMDAASRTVSIDHVTERDLWQIRAMASYWDTLGWVYFANGDSERAERFVKSSWLLVQNPVVGDHLGQIYEKLGRRETVSDPRTIVVDLKGLPGTKADFFVLFSNARAPEAVVFISGDEQLRPMADALRGAKYEIAFPDDTPAKIIRRGTLSCPSDNGQGRCQFTLVLPSDATAADQE